MPAHAGGFHEDDLAAELGPDEPGGHAHLVAGLGHFMGELPGAQELLHQDFVHGEGAGLPLSWRQMRASLRQTIGDFPLQVPETRLPGVILMILADAGVGKLEAQVVQAVLPQLPGDEVIFGDLDLFGSV